MAVVLKGKLILKEKQCQKEARIKQIPDMNWNLSIQSVIVESSTMLAGIRTKISLW